MKKIKTLSGFQTTDGKVYEDYDEAEAHQIEIDMVKIFSENDLFPSDGFEKIHYQRFKRWFNKLSVEDQIAVKNFVDIEMGDCYE